MSKPKQESPKKIWMLTYCPAGTYITSEMLKEHGLVADECHSTADQVVNYTFIHLTRKVRQTGIRAFLKKVHSSHGIVPNEIFGFESISCESQGGDKIQDHVVFRMLLSHCKKQLPSFKPCTDGEPLLKRGLLFAALDANSARVSDPKLMSKQQLIEYTTSLEMRLREAQHQAAEAELLQARHRLISEECAVLRVENFELKCRHAQLGGTNAV
jgi:hypothetical protein